MTMEIEIKNVSTTYIAEAQEFDKNDGVVGRHTLKPGESVKLMAWDTRDIVVREIGECEIKDPIGEDETEAAKKLYKDKSISVERYSDGWMLADYSGNRGPASFTGKSMEWQSQPVISDPFSTKAEAVKYGKTA